MSPKTPDLRLLESAVPSRVLDAMHGASRALTALGIRHALAGGLAVGAHGYARGTSDVDLLVGAEAFEQHPGGVVTLKPGVPIQIDGISIDLLSTTDQEGFLERSLRPPVPGEVSVLPAEALVYLKLKSPRLKDRADVVELLKAGLPAEAAREYLDRHAPAFLARFDECVARAGSEED